jgi:hypothetical protein
MRIYRNISRPATSETSVGTTTPKRTATANHKENLVKEEHTDQNNNNINAVLLLRIRARQNGVIAPFARKPVFTYTNAVHTLSARARVVAPGITCERNRLATHKTHKQQHNKS